MTVGNGATLVDLFERAVGSGADSVALTGPDRSWTWREYGAQVDAVAGRLAEIGVQPGDRVALMTRNTPEFHIADMAVLTLGAVPFSVQAGDPITTLSTLLATAGASVLLTERGYQDIADELSGAGIRCVVHVDTYVATGIGTDARAASERHPVGPEDIATLIFTSGSTGTPKAVQLSHRAVVASLRATDAVAPMAAAGHLLSYLPLTHIAERFMSYYTALATHSTVHCVPDAASLYDDIALVQPTRFFAVPRVYEKLMNRGQALALDDSATVTALGLGRTEYRGVATAPSSEYVLRYFADLGIPVSNIWGMSEAIMCTVNPPEALVAGSVGKFLDSCRGTVAADGELLVRGENVMSGYLGDPLRTNEIFDADGWLHTGDLGRIDANGYLFIEGRKKDMQITATGKNVMPAVIESAVQDRTPLIDRAVAVAEGRRFVTMLMSPEASNLAQFASDNGVVGGTAELTRHPLVLAEIDRAVTAANLELGAAETVRAWQLLPGEWQPGSDELTTTMKLRREKIAVKYADRIAALYL